MRVLRELASAGALPQVTSWRPVLAGWAIAVGLLAWQADQTSATTLLRIIAVLLAVTAVSLVDDAAADVLEPVPVTLAWRRGARLGAAAVAVAVPWSIALLWLRPEHAVALTLECAAITACALAVTAGVAHWSDAPNASLTAAPAVTGAVVVTVLLPPRWALVVPPGDAWRDAHVRWAMLLAVALAAIAVTLQDPAGRSRVRFARGRW